MQTMTKKLSAAVLLLALFTLNACKKEKTPEPTPSPVNIHPPAPLGFVVVGYSPYYRDANTYPDKMFRICNVINYAFANITSSYGVTIRSTGQFNVVYQKAKANGAKVFLSIGETTSLFKDMSSTPERRLTFINDVMMKVRQYKLDGIDIDWEYPRSSDGTGDNYALLMKQLSDSLHVDGKYYLSAAITPGLYAGSVRDGIESKVFGYVDFFNVMVYDDFTTNPNFLYRQHSPYSMAEYCLDYWINGRGMPKEKCVLGIPAYGRPSGMTQSGTVLTYKSILEQGGSPLSDSAVVSAGGFTDYTIYYNGETTVKKKAVYAKGIAGGIMFWEMGQDATDDHSLIKAAADTLGISY